MDRYEQLLRLMQKVAQLQETHYIQDVLFSFNWWFLLAVTIVPWVIWVKVVDRKQLTGIALIGLFVMVLTNLLDDIGSSLMLWDYKYKVLFLTRRLNPVDFSVLPVAFMLVYQYFPQWKHYVPAVTLFSVFAAFIAEPLFVWMDIYTKLHWEYVYSFPIYIAIGILTKWIVLKISSIQCR